MVKNFEKIDGGKVANIDISALKDIQVALDVRKNKLLKIFVRFREGLFQRLDEFAKDAKAKGLRGVEPLVYKVSETEVVQTALMLNGYPLLIVGNDEALPLEMLSEKLAFKLFVYRDYEFNDDAKPLVEVAVFEAQGETYHFKIESPTDEEMHPILHGKSVAREDGVKAADALIHFFYLLKRYWSRKPTLESILSGKASANTMTF